MGIICDSVAITKQLKFEVHYRNTSYCLLLKYISLYSSFDTKTYIFLRFLVPITPFSGSEKRCLCLLTDKEANGPPVSWSHCYFVLPFCIKQQTMETTRLNNSRCCYNSDDLNVLDDWMYCTTFLCQTTNKKNNSSEQQQELLYFWRFECCWRLNDDWMNCSTNFMPNNKPKYSENMLQKENF